MKFGSLGADGGPSVNPPPAPSDPNFIGKRFDIRS
jgi:hypothetical protein